MRANTKKKHNMGKRFAILIGVAATGVMALGAQTAAPAQAVVKYDTKVTLGLHDHDRFTYWVQSKVKKACERGRRVDLFAVRPGADRRVGTARSKYRHGRARGANAVITARKGGRGAWYAKVRREVHDQFVCGGDRSELHDDRDSVVRALGAQTALAGGESVDSTPPDLQLKGPKKQSPQNAKPIGAPQVCVGDPYPCNFIVLMSCGDEACTVRATGRLTNVKRYKLAGSAACAPRRVTRSAWGRCCGRRRSAERCARRSPRART